MSTTRQTYPNPDEAIAAAKAAGWTVWRAEQAHEGRCACRWQGLANRLIRLPGGDWRWVIADLCQDPLDKRRHPQGLVDA